MAIPSEKPYLIAELGVNFYDTARVENITPMQAAKKYVDAAAQAGASAAKFQYYKANKIVSKNSPAYWDLTKEPTATQYDLFKKHDGFNAEDYQELAAYCKEKGIDFLCTPFDYDAADQLDPLVPYFKISSSDASNLPFLRYVAEKGKPIFLSVGACYESEIDEAVRTILDAGCPRLVLLHCVLSYPTKFEDANLNMITRMQTMYPDLEIGYSDHTMPDPSMMVLSMAYMLGATVIEKHFTLDTSLPGNDHYHAGLPEDFARAVANFEMIRKIHGTHTHRVVLDAEKESRKQARRSLVLSRDIKAGEVIQARDLVAKRPGTGIAPQFADILVGKTLREDLPEDTVLTWDELI